MCILAHLAGDMGEPGATQALAYLLNRQAGLLRAFVNLLRPAGIEFQPSPRVESERGDDSEHNLGRPDMKIYDAKDKASDGKPRVLVENKFWADLTGAQPVKYLEQLPPGNEDTSSGLLFIVPRDRVKQMWDVLKKRCRNAGLCLGEESQEDGLRWVQAGVSMMLITDWQNVLETLEAAARGQEIQCDIRQFRQLVEKLENLKAFRVLSDDEVVDKEVPQRIINYVELLRSICRGLSESGIKYDSRAASFEDRSFHRDLTWKNGRGDKVRARLALSFDVWHRSGGITPLWLRIKPGIHRPEVFNALENLLKEEEIRVFPGKNNKYVAIDLKRGVERDSVVEGAVEQISRVVRRLT